MVQALPITSQSAATAKHVQPAPDGIRKLTVYLIKPSRYDDDGYVVRHWRGVLPSNTLACLSGLTDDVSNRKLLGDHLEVVTKIVDETVQSIPFRRIRRESRAARSRLVVALAGVQSNQFARAADVAKQLRAHNVTVMIGGFHVSGMAAMFPEGTPDIEDLLDHGVTVVAGEVEEYWKRLLSDIVNDCLKPSYNFLNDLPDLSIQPLPHTTKDYMKRFAIRHIGTIDASRGCPFSCSFCTIINVQGRKMRCRDATQMRSALIENYKLGINHYFFTDDNFSRNKNWRSILEELIAVREQGYQIGFMMQIDTIAYRIPDFVDVAARAGCSQAFIGMESISPENLAAVGKHQNDTNDYRNMADSWRRAGVATHVGYIIGFPYDTPASVEEDVRKLADEIRVDQASFFILTPLPGSVDHKKLVESGAPIDPDFNNYDSFHVTTEHARMSSEEWMGAYRNAWREFYTLDRMKATLRRTPLRHYWSVFVNFMWYKHSFLVDDSHPMISGFFRLKGRGMRRPGIEVPGRLAYWKQRIEEVSRDMRLRYHLLLELQELWLQTRCKSETELRVADFLNEMARQTKKAKLRFSDWQTAFQNADSKAPSSVRLFFGRLNVFSLRWTYTREDLNNFWQTTRDNLRRGAIYRINWLRVGWNLARDIVITTRFTLAMKRGH